MSCFKVVAQALQTVQNTFFPDLGTVSCKELFIRTEDAGLGGETETNRTDRFFE